MSNYPYVIGFSGKIGSGKNYICENTVPNFLKHKYMIAFHAFADHLKILCHLKDNISYERLFYDKDLQSRRALQGMGMELRENDPDIFIKVIDCHLRLAKDRGIDIVLISDVRLQNEMDYILSVGGIVVRIDSPTRTAIKLRQEVSYLDEEKRDAAMTVIGSHISEVNLDTSNKFYARINNDLGNESLAELHVYDVLRQFLKNKASNEPLVMNENYLIPNTIKESSTKNTIVALDEYLKKYERETLERYDDCGGGTVL